MKKNSFVEGALIATIGIFISRAIGLFYVIPFYSMIGVTGGALYSYGYSIYAVFLSLSSSGIPFAMSKIVGEQTALGNYYTKEKLFKMGNAIILTISFIAFLILMIFAENVAFLIIGDIEGGNTIEDVARVIRIISTALLIVPSLATTKGYLQGHKYIEAPSISKVLEQLVRVAVILIGSYLALNVFGLGIEGAVGIAVFGATAGAITAYLYLMSKIRKHRADLKKDEPLKEGEVLLTRNQLFEKIMIYAIPFVVIDFVKSITSTVDTFTVVRTLTNLGYSAFITENTFGVVSTWGTKINMIVISLAIGITISLIPNLASSGALKNYKDISNKVNQALQVLFITTIPMAVGLSFLAQPVWVIFYGYNEIAIEIFRIMVFGTITFSMFSILVDSLQTLNNTKYSLTALFSTFFIKAAMNIPFMIIAHNIFEKGYLGSTFASLSAHIISIIFMLVALNKIYDVNYNDTFKKTLGIFSSTGLMLLILYGVSYFYPIDAVTRGAALMQIVVYSVLGAIVYLSVVYKSNLLANVIGQRRVNMVLDKLKVKKI